MGVVGGNMMRLEDIGFYTLSDERARRPLGIARPLERCELLLTGRCNFRCPYCRHVGGADLDFNLACDLVSDWCRKGRLAHLRLSGGEPTIYPRLLDLVQHARAVGGARLKRIAISTNGSADYALYERLVEAGVNDFSVSLDACCAEDGDKMAGRAGGWVRVAENLPRLAALCYTTAGVVLTPDNMRRVVDIVRFAAGAGCADVRLIPAAQCGDGLGALSISAGRLLDYASRFPIFRYRIDNAAHALPTRGIGATDSSRCPLVLDDMAVLGEKHYPCIIYLREGGSPIGRVGDYQEIRRSRLRWFRQHDARADAICSKNCLDVCVAYNNRAMARRRA